MPFKDGFWKRMARGVRIEGYLTKPARTYRLGEQAFRIILTEGKKHQIRRMCAALGNDVRSLKRKTRRTKDAGGQRTNYIFTKSGSCLIHNKNIPRARDVFYLFFMKLRAFF